MWFCYESNMKGGWCPVIHYLVKPDAKSDRTKGKVRTPPVEVPDDCIGADGEGDFKLLTERFPPPRDYREELKNAEFD